MGGQTARRTEMKKTYNIEVDCANCANLMESAAAKVEGVRAVTVSFMTQRMTVELEDGTDEGRVMKQLVKACRRVEPDFSIEL